MFTLITITRITTAAPATANTQKIAKAIAKTGKNIIPLYVRNVGTVTQPEYELVHPTREQLETLAAVRAAKAANPLHCNAYCLVVGREEVEGICHAEEDVMDQLDIPAEEAIATAPAPTAPRQEDDWTAPVATPRSHQLAQWIASLPAPQREQMVATLPATGRELVAQYI